MSDIGAAIIQAAGTLIAKGMGLVFRRKDVPLREPVEAACAPRVEAVPTIPQLPTPPPKQGPISALSHKEIVDAIEAVPPFHQQKMHEGFVGAWIRWKTTYSSIYHWSDWESVTLDTPGGHGLVHCRARAEDCELFRLAPEGMEIQVTGRISRISRYETHLEHCTFEAAPHGQK